MRLSVINAILSFLFCRFGGVPRVSVPEESFRRKKKPLPQHLIKFSHPCRKSICGNTAKIFPICKPGGFYKASITQPKVGAVQWTS